MVRLRVAEGLKEEEAKIHFNSTMVRLRVSYNCNFEPMRSIFQFHYGTIESHARTIDTTGQHTFQFHYGTIERGTILLTVVGWFVISIPLWYD